MVAKPLHQCRGAFRLAAGRVRTEPPPIAITAGRSRSARRAPPSQTRLQLRRAIGRRRCPQAMGLCDLERALSRRGAVVLAEAPPERHPQRCEPVSARRRNRVRPITPLQLVDHILPCPVLPPRHDDPVEKNQREQHRHHDEPGHGTFLPVGDPPEPGDMGRARWTRWPLADPFRTPSRARTASTSQERSLADKPAEGWSSSRLAPRSATASASGGVSSPPGATTNPSRCASRHTARSAPCGPN